MAKRLYKLGSLAQDTRTGLKTLFVNSLNAKYDTLEYPSGTPYQVPAAKTFYITRLLMRTSLANSYLTLYYGDNAVSGAAAPPANGVKISTAYIIPTALVLYDIEIFKEIPAEKYPCVNALIGTVAIEVYGLEI